MEPAIIRRRDMKKLHTVLAFVTLALFGSSAQSYRSVAVNLNDGSNVEINLSDNLSATFSEDALILSNGDQEVSVPRNNIKSFTFSKDPYSGISEIESEKNSPTLIGANMVFDCLPENSKITVYDLAGVVLKEDIASGFYSIDLSEFTSGPVIVKVNGISYKIAVKQ